MVTGGICGIVALVLTIGRSVRFDKQSNACFNGPRSSHSVVIYLLIGTNILTQGK